MKTYRITLTEQQFQQFETIIGEMPTRFGNPLINIYANSVEIMTEDPKPIRPVKMNTQNVYEDPRPIGGGGGGGAPKPKP